MKKELRIIIDEAAILGYDIEGLMNTFSEYNAKLRDLIDGYKSSKDKDKFLENLLKGKLKPVNRIYFYTKQLESLTNTPSTRIVRDFLDMESIQEINLTYEELTEVEPDDNTIYRAVIFKDDVKEAMLIDIEYIDDDTDGDILSVWKAKMNYEKAVDHLNEYGESDLLLIAEEIADVFDDVNDYMAVL